MDIIKPKEPRCDGWIKGPDASGTVGMGYQAQYWIHKDGSILVISAIEVATTGERGHRPRVPPEHERPDAERAAADPVEGCQVGAACIRPG